MTKWFLLSMFILYMVLGFDPLNVIISGNAHAYNAGSVPSTNEVHQWITQRAVNYVLSRGYNKSWMYREILLSHLDSLLDGVWRADHTGSSICEWHYTAFYEDRTDKYDCDTIHHYYASGPIETNLFINVADPGDLTASRYAGGLYDMGVKFWPRGVLPDLDSLDRVDAGYTTLPDLWIPFVGIFS